MSVKVLTSVWISFVILCLESPLCRFRTGWDVRFSRRRVWRWLCFWIVTRCSLPRSDRHFRRTARVRSSLCWWRRWAFLKCRPVSTALKGAASQKTAVVNCYWAWSRAEPAVCQADIFWSGGPRTVQRPTYAKHSELHPSPGFCWDDVDVFLRLIRVVPCIYSGDRRRSFASQPFKAFSSYRDVSASLQEFLKDKHYYTQVHFVESPKWRRVLSLFDSAINYEDGWFHGCCAV
jgi:hypothetical protein